MSYESASGSIVRARSVLAEIPGDLTGSEFGDIVQNLTAAIDASTNALESLLEEARRLDSRVRRLEPART